MILFAEQDYRALALLLILNSFFGVCYNDNLNEILILLCKEFENNTSFLRPLNNHNVFDGKRTILKHLMQFQHTIILKRLWERKRFISYVQHTFLFH